MINMIQGIFKQFEVIAKRRHVFHLIHDVSGALVKSDILKAAFDVLAIEKMK